MDPSRASDEALLNVSNHHPLANCQSALPCDYSPTKQHKTPGRRIVRAYTSQLFKHSDKDIENFPSHHPWANSQATLPRGWSPAGKFKTPTKVAAKSYSSLSTRVRTVNHGIRREASKSHGDLSNLRPKSPPIQSLSTPVRHVRERSHVDTGTELQEFNHLRANAYNMGSPSSVGHQIRHALPSVWMSTVLNAQPPSAIEANQAEGNHQQPSNLSPSQGASVQIEKTPVPVPIHGLSSVYSPMDFCVPVSRSHPSILNRHPESRHQASVVDQVDITNTWHGIQWPEAKELFRIDMAFVKILERLLASELHQINLQMLQQQCLNPLLGPPPTSVVRGISFCREQLVSEMAEALYSSEENMVTSQSGLLRLYLAASDSLVQFEGDGSRDTSITVRVSCNQGDDGLIPIVEAAWVPDTISFKDLQGFPREGQEFILIPQYHSKSAFNSTRTPTNMRYSIESKRDLLSWLVWNHEIAGFKGIVPLYTQDPDSRGCFRDSPRVYRTNPYNAVKTLGIDVKAVLIDDNGSSVVYERVLSARLTVKVLPWYSQNAAHSFCEPIQASSNQSWGFAATNATISAHLEAHLPRVDTTSSKATDSYPDELQDFGHKTQESHESQAPIGLPVVAAASKPSELAVLAENYAHLAAKYAELARYQLVQMQAQALGPKQPSAVSLRHDSGSQLQFIDKSRVNEHIGLHTAGQQSASGSSLGSAPAYHTAGLSPVQTSPFIDGRHPNQGQLSGFGTDIAYSASAAKTQSLMPSQEFDGLAWTRVKVQVEAKNLTEQSDLDISTKQQAIPTPKVDCLALRTPTVSPWEGPTSARYNSRNRHTASKMSYPSPLHAAKETQKKRRVLNDTIESNSSKATNIESETDGYISSPALVPGTMFYNSFAPLVDQDDDTSASGERGCRGLDKSSEDHLGSSFQASGVRKIDSGYHADLASFVGMPTPVASSDGGSRQTSGSVDISSGSNESNHQKDLHDQAVLWRMLTKAKEDQVCDRKQNKAEAEVEETRLSADEKKAMEAAMQRSINEMVGGYDDVFLQAEESGAGFEGSSGSEEL